MQNKPTLQEHEIPFWVAFCALSHGRNYIGQFGTPAGIPYSEIHCYALRHPVFEDDFDQFYEVITAIDVRFLELADVKLKKEMEKRKPKK